MNICSYFSCSCVKGSYKYGGKDYPVSASPSGSSMHECRRVALKALKVNETTCTHMKCTFGGVWNGGGGDGQKNLFVASFFFDRAAEVLILQVKSLVKSNFLFLCLTLWFRSDISGWIYQSQPTSSQSSSSGL